MTATATRSRPAATPGRVAARRKQQRPGLPTVLAGVAVLVLAGLIAVLSVAEQPPVSDVQAFGEVTVDGDPLPRYPGPGVEDPAVGAFAPEITGTDLAGDAVEVIPDGRPKMLVFLAHWCQFCQAELPVIADWMGDGGLPDGVDLVAVTTGTSDVQPNFPPGPWLEREGYAGPVVVDDRAQTLGDGFGLTGYPYWVFLDAGHEVVSRASGALGREQIDTIARQLAAGGSTAGTHPGGSSEVRIPD